MGLEVVVRPVVFPNIRPTRPRMLAKPDNPDQGMMVLSGGGGTFVGTSYSFSYSYSSSAPHKEKKRQVDKKRIYQTEEDVEHGTNTVNKDNFVDVEVTKKMLLVGGTEPQRLVYGPFKDAENVEVLETDVTKFPGKD